MGQEPFGPQQEGRQKPEHQRHRPHRQEGPDKGIGAAQPAPLNMHDKPEEHAGQKRQRRREDLGAHRGAGSVMVSPVRTGCLRSAGARAA